MVKRFVFVVLILMFMGSCANSCKELKDRFTMETDSIIARIKPPQFKYRVYNILNYGAVADSITDCKPSIDSAITACISHGGGQVLIPKGTFYCKGPIHLLSNVNLHLDEGAKLYFSADGNDYLPNVFVRWEGVEIYNYSPFIYANGQHNIAITGKGILNGNADENMIKWRKMQKPAQKKLRQMGKKLVPVEKRIFGTGHSLRPSFIQFLNCRNIRIAGIKIENVPFWVIHPTYCQNITIQGVRIHSLNLNNDGIDIDSSEDILIENCIFNTGDDAIAIKSGRDNDAWRVNKLSKNIVIRNCVAKTTLHGIAIGSEMSGGIENVYIENFKMHKVEEYGIQFKANKDRGGFVKNIFVRNIEIDTCNTVLFFTNNYHSYSGGNAPSEFKDISINNLLCNRALKTGIELNGLPEKPITNLRLNNITIIGAETEYIIENVKGLDVRNIQINNKLVILNN